MESVQEKQEDLTSYDWDDSELIASYDRSMLRRDKAAKAKKQLKNLSAKENSAGVKWCVGKYCRALYAGDGCYYEAKVRSMGKDGCTVEFLGYGDIEEVDPTTLKVSLGKKARKNQVKSMLEGNSMTSLTESEMSDAPSHESFANRKKLHESQLANHMPLHNHSAAEHGYEHTPHHQGGPYFPPNPMPHTMPFLPPPPAPPMPQCSSIANNPAMSAMLVSWYMAGYYTGLHQNQKGTTSCSQRCCGHSNQCCHH